MARVLTQDDLTARRGAGPLPPDIAIQYADDPKFDPLDRVGFALDAGFADPDFTQEEAARLAGMSTRRLRHLLSKTGSSYRAEILERRMGQAETLLTMTSYLVSAISELCGYWDASTFCRRFADTHGGLTPAQYRVGKGGVRRAGGATGAARRPAERKRAMEIGEPGPTMWRPGPGPGEDKVFWARYEHAGRQARAFGRLSRHADLSFSDQYEALREKRKRGKRQVTAAAGGRR
jgi:AraC-like DNA-binding protein